MSGIIAYLNNLTLQEREKWYAQMCTNFSAALVIQRGSLKNIDETQLRELSNPHYRNINGSLLAEWLACLTRNGEEQLSHLQWQTRLNFDRMPFGSQKKVLAHVLAYAAHNAGPLPELGNGSSIDHLCGQKGCFRPSHLDLAQEHRTNVARIGCLGLILVVIGKVIVSMRPCIHAIPNDDHTAYVLSSCVKIQCITLSDDEILAIKNAIE